MLCIQCNTDKYPVQNIHPSGRIVNACPDCGSAFSVAKPTQGTSKDAKAHLEKALREAATEPPVFVNGAPVERRTAVLSDAASLITGAKARVTEIKSELARMELLKRECFKLEMMIQAAEKADASSP